MRSEHQQRINEFMRRAGQSVPDTLTIPDLETRRLRAKLIYEEAMETIFALGFSVRHDFTNDAEISPQFVEEGTFDLIETIDGCCDLSVVSIGTLTALGLPDKPFLKLVDESNLAKFGPGGHRRADGKWVKPPDWQPPNIAGLIDEVTDLNAELCDE